MGNVCPHTHMHVLECTVVCFYVFIQHNALANIDLRFSTQSECMYVHVRVCMFVCVELVKECTFD